MRIIRFILAVFKFVFLGEKASSSTQAVRTSMCNSCEFNLGKKCEICGCFLKQKIKMSTEKCPINKW